MIARLLHLMAALLDHLRPAGEWSASYAGNTLVSWSLQWLAGMAGQ